MSWQLIQGVPYFVCLLFVPSYLMTYQYQYIFFFKKGGDPFKWSGMGYNLTDCSPLSQHHWDQLLLACLEGLVAHEDSRSLCLFITTAIIFLGSWLHSAEHSQRSLDFFGNLWKGESLLLLYPRALLSVSGPIRAVSQGAQRSMKW